MAVGMLIQFPGQTTDFYDQVMTNLDWGNAPDPPGFVSHYAGMSPDGLVVFDIWKSQEDWENFLNDRLMAAIGAETGGNPPDAQPVFIQIHREEHA
jgi:heme-degrading monooxygenase HmoA